MRLATVVDPETQTPRPVLEHRDGGRISLRRLFGQQAADFWNEPIAAVEHCAEIHQAAARWAGGAEAALQHARLLPPVPLPRTFRDFYAFEQHVATCRARRGLGMQAAWYAQPVFYFSNPLALVGHEMPVFAPAGSNELDYELELGAIIGRPGRDIDPADAWRHVAGFTIINDFSARDLQRQEVAVGLGPAKAKDFATAVGPWLVTLDEFEDRVDRDGRVQLHMSARVNGKELSSGDSSTMYFTWPRIIAHASRDAMLAPGDLIGSGTVGSGCILELGPDAAGGWLKPGDVVELEIERLGILRTPIAARPSNPQ